MARSFYGRTGVSIDDSMVDNFDRLRGVMPAVLESAVRQGAEVIRSRAMELANVSPTVRGNAVDGRHMRDCIDIAVTTEPSGANAQIFIDMSNVPYAAHQEFGDRGKPFMRPAMDESRQEVHEVMRQIIAEGLGSVGPVSAVRFRRFA